MSRYSLPFLCKIIPYTCGWKQTFQTLVQTVPDLTMIQLNNFKQQAFSRNQTLNFEFQPLPGLKIRAIMFSRDHVLLTWSRGKKPKDNRYTSRTMCTQRPLCLSLKVDSINDMRNSTLHHKMGFMPEAFVHLLVLSTPKVGWAKLFCLVSCIKSIFNRIFSTYEAFTHM